MISRRLFVGGLLAATTAPAIIRSGILMPVRKIVSPDLWITIPLHTDKFEYTFLDPHGGGDIWTPDNRLYFDVGNEWWNSPLGGMFDGRAAS